jgi:transposase
MSRPRKLPEVDEGVLRAIQTDLAEKDLLPEQHLVDAGYVTIANLVKTSADYGVDLVGPTLKTRLLSSGDWLGSHAFLHRLASRDGHLPTGPDQFELDTGPGRRQTAHQGEVFAIRDCQVCPSRTSCTGTTRRSLTLHPREQMQALFAARQRESTDAFKQTYRHRAGIEGTHSQGVRTMGLRRSRYSGLRKTHLGHVVVAAAVNVIQLMSWLRGEAPEQTRTSAFKQVMKQAT